MADVGAWLKANSDEDRELTPAEQAMYDKIEADNAEWMEQEQERLRKMRMPSNPVSAGWLGASARVNQYVEGAKNLFRSDEDDVDTSEIKENMAPVREAYPKAVAMGEFLTDMALTAPIGLGSGAVASRTLGTVAKNAPAIVQRGVTGLGMGVGEGATMGLAQDDIATDAAVGGGIGAVSEMALPPLFSKIAKILKKSPVRAMGRELSDEFKEMLAQTGLAVSDVERLGLADMPKNMTETQVARLLLFKANETPTTRSRITQTAGDFAEEERLVRQIGDPGSDVLRVARADEAAGIQSRLTQVHEDLGVGSQAGESIKIALEGLESGQQQLIRDAYGELGEWAAENGAGRIPLRMDKVRAAVDEVMFGTKPVSDETRGAIERAAAKFGLYGDDITKRGNFSIVDYDGQKIKVSGDVTPLNLENFEDFRQDLNRAFQRDSTSSITDVKRALDDTVTEATDILATMNEGNQFVQDLAENARNTVIARKELLDTGTLVPRLLQQNPRTGTPFTEASQVSRKIFSQSTSPEEVARLMRGLGEAGEAGAKAISDLQASVGMELLDKAFSNGTKLAGGQTEFGIRAFEKELKRMGPETLDIIFESNQAALNVFKQIEEMGRLMRTPGSAVQKGSAPDLINWVQRLTRAIGFGSGDVSGAAGAAVAGHAINAGKAKAVRKEIIDMVNLNEEEAITFITQSYPSLAGVLGFTAFGTERLTDDGR